MKEFFKKYQTQILAAVFLIVAGVIIYVAFKPSDTKVSNSMDSAVTPPPAPPVLKPAPPGASKQITTLQIVGKPMPGKSYQSVVETYKDRRIQFDDACRATPNYLTFKNGPEIMFDNRSIGEKIIKLNDISYKIGAYGFIVLQITAPSLPYQIDIDCNQLFNVASINLQK